ncbi:hypothetical protein [Hyalangium rubrum]|uniref:Lipoprotein n=1 Tax=Hyalangium rubrum TaxID=3103134 RepID=A0ABU5HDF2_9BACT|nr:hypothetical protein [Hyalangium sp. s54d21]MDY7231501.1 hypothetical protein [Hyalangium sp. s54d21]
MNQDIRLPSKRVVRQAWALLGALAMMGCSSSRPNVQEEAEAERPSSSGSLKAELPPDPLNVKTFAAQYPNPSVCERQARRYLPTSREDAWAALKACAEGTYFTQLQALLSPEWAPELRSRPEAAALLARVVALRGGSVDGDLRLLHERRLPIFSLSSAIAQPDTYKGRYILVRAQVGDMRSEDEKPTVWLVEQGLGSVASEQPVGVVRRKESNATTSGNLGGQTTLGGGQLAGSFSKNETRRSGDTVIHYDNVSSDTGREALGRLTKADPFLSPGKDFVILARFDGMRTTSGAIEGDDDGPRIPVLSIVSYYIPHPLVVY